MDQDMCELKHFAILILSWTIISKPPQFRCGPHLDPAPRPSFIYCASPFLVNPLLIPHFEWNIGLCSWGVMIVTWFHEKLAQVTKSSQSHRTCVAGSSCSRNLSQMGSSASPDLKRGFWSPAAAFLWHRSAHVFLGPHGMRRYLPYTFAIAEHSKRSATPAYYKIPYLLPYSYLAQGGPPRSRTQWQWHWQRTDSADSHASSSHRMLRLELGEHSVVLSTWLPHWFAASSFAL
jgi:hypothetical protein